MKRTKYSSIYPVCFYTILCTFNSNHSLYNISDYNEWRAIENGFVEWVFDGNANGEEEETTKKDVLAVFNILQSHPKGIFVARPHS